MNAPAAFGTACAPFRTVTELRDAVLGARPPDPRFVRNGSPGDQAEHQLLCRAIEAWRNGQAFAFGAFDINSDEFHELSTTSLEAFAEGLIGLPYPVFCGVAGITLNNETRLAMVMAEEVDNLKGVDGCDLGEGWAVHLVVPLLRPNGGVRFEPVSPMLRFFAEGGKAYARPVEPPVGKFQTDMLDIQLRVLEAMAALLADRRVTVSREPAPVKVNAARAKRSRPAIPALWRVTTDAIADLYVTKINTKQPHGEDRGRHHRSPVPHSRRGHQRRLRSGKVTWVRSCAVGALVRHLTRRRDFYALNPEQGKATS